MNLQSSLFFVVGSRAERGFELIKLEAIGCSLNSLKGVKS